MSANVLYKLERQTGIWENLVQIPTLSWKLAGQTQASHCNLLYKVFMRTKRKKENQYWKLFGVLLEK